MDCIDCDDKLLVTDLISAIKTCMDSKDPLIRRYGEQGMEYVKNMLKNPWFGAQPKSGKIVHWNRAFP